MHNIFNQISKPKPKSVANLNHALAQQIAAKLEEGLALHNAGQLEQARATYEEILKLNPKHFNALQLSGTIAAQTKQWDKALGLLNDALKIDTTNASVYNNRGIVLKELNRLEEALTSFERAIEFKPSYADAYNNRGNVLKELKRLEEALTSFERAIEFRPDYAEFYWNKCLSHLLNGDLTEGWNLYEYGWIDSKQRGSKIFFNQPIWLGKESLVNKKILLYSEQGLGDTLQFCRYAKLVSALGAIVILEVQKPLFNLLLNLEGVSQIVAKGSALPEFDYQCPLMSLPLAFKTVIESIPNKVPYIHTTAVKQDKWREHICDAGFKIAICWQGNSKNKIDIGRSFPVSLFEGLAKIDGVRLISLQKNEGVEQLKNLPIGMKVETLPDDFDSGENAFLDSAAVMKCVDLVISSDTALTHLAGALGVKTWLPLKYVPDWRRMLDRQDSPWYPNHRLFRQTTRDDWKSVFNEMEAELISLVSTKTTTQQ